MKTHTLSVWVIALCAFLLVFVSVLAAEEADVSVDTAVPPLVQADSDVMDVHYPYSSQDVAPSDVDTLVDSDLTILPSAQPSSADDPDVASELVEINIRALPQVIVVPSIEDEEPLSDVEEQDVITPRQTPQEPFEVVHPTETMCHSGRTDFILENSFDCGEGIQESDRKATPLYTNRGKKYAYLEVGFPRDDVSPSAKLKILHAAEFPTQQVFSVFYQEDNIWKGVCHNLRTTRSGGVSECDVSTPALKHKNLRFRIEAYSREGEAIWSINDVDLATAIAQRQPRGQINAPDNIPRKITTLQSSLVPGAPQPPVPSDPGLAVTGTADAGSSGLRATGEYSPPHTETEVNPATPTIEEVAPSEQTPVPPVQDTLETPPQRGLLSLTGAAIADLATKNPFGAFITIVLVGLVAYKGYTFFRSRR